MNSGLFKSGRIVDFSRGANSDEGVRREGFLAGLFGWSDEVLLRFFSTFSAMAGMRIRCESVESGDVFFYICLHFLLWRARTRKYKGFVPLLCTAKLTWDALKKSYFGPQGNNPPSKYT